MEIVVKWRRSAPRRPPAQGLGVSTPSALSQSAGGLGDSLPGARSRNETEIGMKRNAI